MKNCSHKPVEHLSLTISISKDRLDTDIGPSGDELMRAVAVSQPGVAFLHHR